MEIKIDRAANAAYIQIADRIGAATVAKTYQCDPAEVGGMINIDFDMNGRILGIELIDADHYLDTREQLAPTHWPKRASTCQGSDREPAIPAELDTDVDESG